MVQFLCAESDEGGRVDYLKMYHSLHGNRYLIGTAKTCGQAG
jgi:hypothetical protein